MLAYRAIIAPMLLLCLTISSCATAIQPSRTPEQTSSLIAQLEEAKRVDAKNSLAPDVLPVAQGDFMIAASRAGIAIDKLGRGEYVSDKEIDQALMVPPKKLSRKDR